MSETQGENKPAPAAQAPKKEKKVLDEETKRKYAEIAAQKKAEAQAKRKAEAEARKAQGIKKKEAIKKDTSQLLGIEAKKEECFSEWYSQVITRAELLDYYDVSGIHLFELYFFLSVFTVFSFYLHSIFTPSSPCFLPNFFLTSSYLLPIFILFPIHFLSVFSLLIVLPPSLCVSFALFSLGLLRKVTAIASATATVVTLTLTCPPPKRGERKNVKGSDV